MKSWIFIGLLVSILCGGVFYYYTTTQETIRVLLTNNATMKSDLINLNSANKQNVETIDELQREYMKIQEDFVQLESDFRDIQDQADTLNEKFAEHDLNKLAVERPKTIERVLNNATEETLRCFELMSGAPLTQKEREAENENQFNSECPWLWTAP